VDNTSIFMTGAPKSLSMISALVTLFADEPHAPANYRAAILCSGPSRRFQRLPNSVGIGEQRTWLEPRHRPARTPLRRTAQAPRRRRAMASKVCRAMPPAARPAACTFARVRRAVAQAMPERLQDEVALDLGDGAADERTRDLLGGERGVGDRRRAALPFGGRTLARCDNSWPRRKPGTRSTLSSESSGVVVWSPARAGIRGER